MGLYSGYRVDTREDSYAWIDLDSVKLTKMDEGTEVEILKKDFQRLHRNLPHPVPDGQLRLLTSRHKAQRLPGLSRRQKAFHRSLGHGSAGRGGSRGE